METHEVVEMIDTITAGEYFAHAWPTIEGSNSLSIEMGREGKEDQIAGDGQIWFSSFDAKFLAKIDDPRTAREIAGALVAWANKKEGKLQPRVDSIVQDIQWYQTEEGAPKKSETPWRANWYKRNVSDMSQETKQRNLQDLKKELQSTDPVAENLDVLEDIQRAIQILLRSGVEKPTPQCTTDNPCGSCSTCEPHVNM